MSQVTEWAFTLVPDLQLLCLCNAELFSTAIYTLSGNHTAVGQEHGQTP